MRIRRNPLRMLGLPFSNTTQLVQPEALPSEASVFVPTPASRDATAAAVTVPVPVPSELCLQSYAWTSHPHALNPKEPNYDDDGLTSDAWREPRENPGLSYVNMDFMLRQQEVDTEAEVEDDIYHVKKRNAEDKTGKKKPDQQVNKKMKRDGNQQDMTKMMVVAKVIKKAANKPSKCKKTDGRKWKCANDAVVPHTLCEKHLRQSRSYYNSKKEAPGANSKSAPQESSTSSKATPAKAPASTKAVSASSKAAPSTGGARPSSKRPRKEVDDYSGGAFYYPESFGPFRGKQRGHCSSSELVEATTTIVEGERSTQVDGGTTAPEGSVFLEASLSNKVARKQAKLQSLDLVHTCSSTADPSQKHQVMD